MSPPTPEALAQAEEIVSDLLHSHDTEQMVGLSDSGNSPSGTSPKPSKLAGLPKPYYQDSAVTLYLGDCWEILPNIRGVGLVMTSPPFNQMSSVPKKASGLWSRSTGGAGFVRAWGENGYPDEVDERRYQALQNTLFSGILNACTPWASLFYNHQVRWRDGQCLHPIAWFTPTGWNLRQEIIWDRAGGMMMNARMFCRFDERILWFVRGPDWKWNQSVVGHGTIWSIARMQQQQGKEHPVEFPQAIPSRCIAATTDVDDLVLDPFAGSGTTLRAAKDLGRRAIGIEIEERYCEIAAKRLRQEVLTL